MIRVVVAPDRPLLASETEGMDLVVQAGRVVQARDSRYQDREVPDLEGFLHELARDNPGRAADVEVIQL